MAVDQAKLFSLAWEVVPRLPIGLVEGVSAFAGRVIAALGGSSVRQLRRNMATLTGRQPTRREVSDAVASYFRCFGQQFALPGVSEEWLRLSTDYPRAGEVRELLKEGPVVLALTHSGNWDLAGAWFGQNCGPIVTVAEKLDPPELFQKFVEFRESLGMEVIGVGKGESVFEELVRRTEGRGVFVPLLADRDISGSGIEVTLGTQRALVAAGPAALALRLGRPLVAGHITYKREGRFPRRRWALSVDISEPLVAPDPAPGETAVEALTRAWVRRVEPAMIAGVRDWHMMQRLYVSDLDPERLRRARDRHQRGTAEEKGGQS